MKVTIDIETIPAQSNDVCDQLKADAAKEKAEVKAPSNYKDTAKIEEYIAAKHAEIDAGIDERWRKTGLDGAYGQIAVIGVAINDEEPIAFYQDDWATSESTVITDFFMFLSTIRDGLNSVTFIGHNLVAFDLRFMFQRAVINGIVPPSIIPFNAKLWDNSVFDTMVQWAGVGNRVSLDKLCGVFGLPKKGEIDGSKVWDYVKSGRIAEVAEYCMQDVMNTRAVYRRMTFAGV